MAAGEDDHDPQPDLPRSVPGARAIVLSTNAAELVVFDNDTVNPYAHQVNAGVTHMLTSDLAVTADFTTVFRYSDRDIVDLNLPDSRAGDAGEAVSAVRPRQLRPADGRQYLQGAAGEGRKAHVKRHQSLVSYTLSKAEDTNFSNRSGDRYGYVRDSCRPSPIAAIASSRAASCSRRTTCSCR